MAKQVEESLRLGEPMQTPTALESMSPNHMSKLFEITDGRIGFPINLYERLINSGFKIFVQADFIRKFTFHTTLKGEGVIYDQGRETFYIGDIPDSILLRAREVIKCGIKYLTLHSAQPLAVAPYSKTDPILLGWANNPRISSSTVNGKYTLQILRPQWAVVVGIWDYDTEVKSLYDGHLL